jgi:hypothetical protein
VLLYINIGQTGQQISTKKSFASAARGSTFSRCATRIPLGSFNPSSLDISMKIDYLLSYCWVSMLRRCSRCPATSRARVESRDSRERDSSRCLGRSLCSPADATSNSLGCLRRGSEQIIVLGSRSMLTNCPSDCNSPSGV